MQARCEDCGTIIELSEDEAEAVKIRASVHVGHCGEANCEGPLNKFEVEKGDLVRFINSDEQGYVLEFMDRGATIFRVSNYPFFSTFDVPYQILSKGGGISYVEQYEKEQRLKEKQPEIQKLEKEVEKLVKASDEKTNKLSQIRQELALLKETGYVCIGCKHFVFINPPMCVIPKDELCYVCHDKKVDSFKKQAIEAKLIGAIVISIEPETDGCDQPNEISEIVLERDSIKYKLTVECVEDEGWMEFKEVSE